MPQRNDAGHPDEVFADGIGWIGVQGGVVRIDFFSFAAPGTTDAAGKAPETEPERIVRQRIVMPVDGFLRSLHAMNDLVRKLEDGGLVVRKPGTPAAPGAGAAPPRPSPNFG